MNTASCSIYNMYIAVFSGETPQVRGWVNNAGRSRFCFAAAKNKKDGSFFAANVPRPGHQPRAGFCAFLPAVAGVAMRQPLSVVSNSGKNHGIILCCMLYLYTYVTALIPSLPPLSARRRVCLWSTRACVLRPPTAPLFPPPRYTRTHRCHAPPTYVQKQYLACRWGSKTSSLVGLAVTLAAWFPFLTTAALVMFQAYHKNITGGPLVIPGDPSRTEVRSTRRSHQMLPRYRQERGGQHAALLFLGLRRRVDR